MELTDITTDRTLELVITDIPVPLSRGKALDVGLMLRTASERSPEAWELALRVIDYYEHELKESEAYVAAVRHVAPSMYARAVAYQIATRAVINDILNWMRRKFKVDVNPYIIDEQSKR